MSQFSKRISDVFPPGEEHQVGILPVMNASFHHRFVLPTISHIFPSRGTAAQTSPEVQIRSADKKTIFFLET